MYTEIFLLRQETCKSKQKREIEKAIYLKTIVTHYNQS